MSIHSSPRPPARTSTPASDKFDRLVGLLRELFQLDQPDLDFGLYRILHAKSGEVTQFLEKDLLPQVKRAFEQYQPADKAAIKKNLDQAVAAAESLSVDPDTNERVLQLRAELAEGADLEALENEVYDHLYSFFRRYYSEGDFLAKRVYKPGVYAVPYEGEEVVLHWANKDQYYIKTSEYLRDYAFRLKPEAAEGAGDPMRVHFRLVAATEGEHGVNKAAEGKDRVFVIAPAGESGHDFLSVETVEGREELVIGFEYRPAIMDDWTDGAKAQATTAAKKKPPKQKDLIDIAVKAVLVATGDSFDGWIRQLEKPHTKVNGETAHYSRLEGHLNRYCARHTFDYFIHKNLGGFLRRELDFYIKNEVMHLDDVQNEDAPKVEQYLSKIKVIRTIAGKVIDFLHQLEEFQRKLWLKKKFVTETFYCVRLDAIPDELLPEVAANEAQRQEWVDLLGIDKQESTLGQPAFSSPLTMEYLKAFPSLTVDTRHFSDAFVSELLASIGDLDDVIDGIVFHADNFHAIRMLGSRFSGGLKTIYIDPPYNTDAGPIDYKNGYRSSSWMTLMADRLEQAHPLLRADGILCVTIDDYQVNELALLLDSIFGSERNLGVSVIRNNPSGRSTVRGLSICHEYALYYQRTELANLARLPRTEQQLERFEVEEGQYVDWRNFRKDGGAVTYRTERPKQYYPIYVRQSDLAIRVPEMDWDSSDRTWICKEDPSDGEEAVYPIDANGNERVWSLNSDSARAAISDLEARRTNSGEIQVYRKHTPTDGVVPRSWWDKNVYAAREHGSAALTDLFGESKVFSFAKSPHAVKDCVWVSGLNSPESEWVLDFFAGSGTTAHAVLNMNREDDGARRFVLVEMGAYIETVLLPRIKKVNYAAEWKSGSPILGEAYPPAGARMVKVVRLESYEDALNNLREADKTANGILDGLGDSAMRESFMLRYMLEISHRGSPSLLDVEGFMDPNGYQLTTRPAGADDSIPTVVDLVETFNWLLGLRVASVAPPKTFTATFNRDPEGRLGVKGRIKEGPDGPWWFRTVTGTTPDGKRALIIWRKRPGGDEPEGIEQDNAVLDAWFRTQGYSTTDSEFDIVWVNGDNNLANLRQDEMPDDGLGETGWKVRIIEQDFHRLMFDTSDVPGAA